MEKIKWIEAYLEEALKLAWMEGHEPALKLLDRLLYEEPGYARLHYTLGLIYFDYGDDLQRAQQHFKMAIRFDKEFADSYWYLGRLLADDDRLDEALQIYKQGMKAKQAKKAHLLEQVGKTYELKKQFNKAISRYQKALRHSAELWHCLVLEESIKRCKRKQR